MSTAAQWDALHREPRHRLEYPSEHVVRWLAGVEGERALDIGCGSGRHTALLRERFIYVDAVDASETAVEATEALANAALYVDRWAVGVTRADMTLLPFVPDYFDVSLAFGVFYYGTRAEHQQAVAEMRRVMRAGARGFVCIRTDNDWRQRFTHGGVFHCHGEPEDGMPMHFLTEYEVQTMYGAFAEVRLELTETTTRGRTRCDSDWLISVTK